MLPMVARMMIVTNSQNHQYVEHEQQDGLKWYESE